MTEPAIDMETFRALQESAGAEFVVELVDAFLEDAPRMLATLQQSLGIGDTDAFRRAAHSLKSNAVTFGAHPLGAMARDLELSAPAVVQHANALALDAILAEHRRVDAALRELKGA